METILETHFTESHEDRKALWMIIFTRILEKEILFSVKFRNKNFTVQNLFLYF